MDPSLITFFIVQLEKIKAKLAPLPAHASGSKKPSLSEMDEGRKS